MTLLQRLKIWRMAKLVRLSNTGLLLDLIEHWAQSLQTLFIFYVWRHLFFFWAMNFLIKACLDFIRSRLLGRLLRALNILLLLLSTEDLVWLFRFTLLVQHHGLARIPLRLFVWIARFVTLHPLSENGLLARLDWYRLLSLDVLTSLIVFVQAVGALLVQGSLPDGKGFIPWSIHLCTFLFDALTLDWYHLARRHTLWLIRRFVVDEARLPSFEMFDFFVFEIAILDWTLILCSRLGTCNDRWWALSSENLLCVLTWVLTLATQEGN